MSPVPKGDLGGCKNKNYVLQTNNNFAFKNCGIHRCNGLCNENYAALYANHRRTFSVY